MAARSPRRSFATPFVITLAAAPAACYVQSSPGPTQPPPSQQQQPVQQTNTTTTPPPNPVVMNPPRPTDQTSTPDTRPNPVVMNPPRPQPTDQTTTPTPPAGGTEVRWTVMKIGNNCQATTQTSCPKGAMCNPPPPYKYACPADMSADQTLALVSHDGGATCTLEFPMPKCPPNAMCNPPRPRPAACPTR